MFAVKTAGADVGGLDVATLDPDRVSKQTADDMRITYAFTDYQNTTLDELLSDRAALTSLAGSPAITSADVREVPPCLTIWMRPAGKP